MTVLNKRRELVFSVPQGTGFDSVLGNLAVTDGNTLTSSNIDGNIIIDPNGDGEFIVQANTGIGVDDPQLHCKSMHRQVQRGVFKTILFLAAAQVKRLIWQPNVLQH